MTFGEDTIVIGSVPVSLPSTLSASAAAFVPTAPSVSASVPASVSVPPSEQIWDHVPGFDTAFPSLTQVYVTPLRSRGGAPSDCEVDEMVIIKTSEQFLAKWASLPEEERGAFELEHTTNPEQAVVNEALKKVLLRQNVTMQAMGVGLAQARAEADAAKAAADAARAEAQVNHNSASALKPKPPPTFENREKDLSIQKWLPVVESYLSDTPDKDYLRVASSLLGGKPRSFWQSKYDLHLKGGLPIDNPLEFFREVMMSGYGLKDEVQQHWDTWNKLHQGKDDISDYNIAFEQARTDLVDEIHDEAVFIEKYKSGLQKDIRELARVSPSGQRWTSPEGSDGVLHSALA